MNFEFGIRGTRRQETFVGAEASQAASARRGGVGSILCGGGLGGRSEAKAWAPACPPACRRGIPEGHRGSPPAVDPAGKLSRGGAVISGQAASPPGRWIRRTWGGPLYRAESGPGSRRAQGRIPGAALQPVGRGETTRSARRRRFWRWWGSGRAVSAQRHPRTRSSSFAAMNGPGSPWAVNDSSWRLRGHSAEGSGEENQGPNGEGVHS